MSIVTKRGDRGTTALMYNRQVSKCDPRVEAYGAVDELTAALGLARAHLSGTSWGERLLETQKVLILVMGELATAPEDLTRYKQEGFETVAPPHATRLETWVKEIEAAPLRLKGWAIPGQNVTSSTLEVARTACRRAERRVCALAEAGELTNGEIIIFLNRLSDFLWLLARLTESQPQ